MAIYDIKSLKVTKGKGLAMMRNGNTAERRIESSEKSVENS